MFNILIDAAKTVFIAKVNKRLMSNVNERASSFLRCDKEDLYNIHKKAICHCPKLNNVPYPRYKLPLPMGSGPERISPKLNPSLYVFLLRPQHKKLIFQVIGCQYHTSPRCLTPDMKGFGSWEPNNKESFAQALPRQTHKILMKDPNEYEADSEGSESTVAMRRPDVAEDEDYTYSPKIITPSSLKQFHHFEARESFSVSPRNFTESELASQNQILDAKMKAATARGSHSRSEEESVAAAAIPQEGQPIES